MCCCGLKPKTTLQCLSRCNHYSDFRTELITDICALNPTLENVSREKLLNILLYEAEDYSFSTNKKITKSTIKFWKTLLAFSFDFLYSKEYWMDKSLFKDHMCICVHHLNASVLWVVSLLGPLSFRFYFFVVL